MFEYPNLVAYKLNYKIGTKTILADIDFTAHKGEVLGILGPNGAGKTSLLKILSGQIPSQGNIHLQQKPLRDFSDMEKARQIAVVNQINQHVFSHNLL